MNYVKFMSAYQKFGKVIKYWLKKPRALRLAKGTRPLGPFGRYDSQIVT